MPAGLTFEFRRGTAAEWTAANPVLRAGEPGVELDTLKFKLGDGTTAWTSLAYAGGGAGSYTAATGLTLTGSAFSINTAVTVDKTTAQALTNKTIGNTNSVAADAITSATVGTARLGTGSASNTTFLRGDQTWAAPSAGTWTGDQIAVTVTDPTADAIIVNLADNQSGNILNTIASPVADTFTRADSTTTLGTTTVGAKAWQALGGSTWGISSNKAYVVTGTNDTAIVDTGYADGTITANITMGGTLSTALPGIAFRVFDTNNKLFVVLRGPGPELNLRIVDGGVETGLVTLGSMGWVAGQTYAIKVVLAGLSVKVYVDTVLKITYTLGTGSWPGGVLTSKYQFTTNHGMRINASDHLSRIDDWRWTGTTFSINAAGTLAPFQGVLPQFATQGDRYVDYLNGSDANDGLSWGKPYKTIDAALQNLLLQNYGDIWLADTADHIVTTLIQLPQAIRLHGKNGNTAVSGATGGGSRIVWNGADSGFVIKTASTTGGADFSEGLIEDITISIPAVNPNTGTAYTTIVPYGLRNMQNLSKVSHCAAIGHPAIGFDLYSDINGTYPGFVELDSCWNIGGTYGFYIRGGWTSVLLKMCGSDPLEAGVAAFACAPPFSGRAYDSTMTMLGCKMEGLPQPTYAVTTNSTTTVLSARWLAKDVGKSAFRTGVVPANTTVVSVVPGVSAVLSAAALTTGATTLDVGPQAGGIGDVSFLRVLSGGDINISIDGCSAKHQGGVAMTAPAIDYQATPQAPGLPTGGVALRIHGFDTQAFTTILSIPTTKGSGPAVTISSPDASSGKITPLDGFDGCPYAPAIWQGTHKGFVATTPVLNSPTGLAVPRIAVVAADVTHAQSSTTLSDITGLLVPVSTSATEIWFVEAYLLVNAANTTVDFKLGWTVPASCTMNWGIATGGGSGYIGTTASSSANILSTAASTSGGIGSNNGTTGQWVAGHVFGGGTAGNVQLQFAQNTSDASDLKILKGSMLRYTRLVA